LKTDFFAFVSTVLDFGPQLCQKRRGLVKITRNNWKPKNEQPQFPVVSRDFDKPGCVFGARSVFGTGQAEDVSPKPKKTKRNTDDFGLGEPNRMHKCQHRNSKFE
jgi:hypothetical protein